MTVAFGLTRAPIVTHPPNTCHRRRHLPPPLVGPATGAFVKMKRCIVARALPLLFIPLLLSCTTGRPTGVTGPDARVKLPTARCWEKYASCLPSGRDSLVCAVCLAFFIQFMAENQDWLPCWPTRFRFINIVFFTKHPQLAAFLQRSDLKILEKF